MQTLIHSFSRIRFGRFDEFGVAILPVVAPGFGWDQFLAVCLAKTSYTRQMNDLPKSLIRTVPI